MRAPDFKVPGDDVLRKKYSEIQYCGTILSNIKVIINKEMYEFRSI